jgi:hypothetical protein
MTDEKKPMKVEFAPGCFDNFEGTQEELDQLQAEIIAMFESGEIEAEATELDLDALMEEDPEYAAIIMEALMNDHDEENSNRKLH